MNSMMIKDNATRDVVREVEKKQEAISNIPMLPANATLAQVIEVVNQITNSRKRK